MGEALRVARLAIRSDPGTSHPFYWAGFILVGEDRAAIPIERHRTAWWAGLLLIAATAAVALLGRVLLKRGRLFP